MKIEEHDFILESVDDPSHFYNLQLQKVVNKGKANERTAFGDTMYGIEDGSTIMALSSYKIKFHHPYLNKDIEIEKKGEFEWEK